MVCGLWLLHFFSKRKTQFIFYDYLLWVQVIQIIKQLIVYKKKIKKKEDNTESNKRHLGN